MFCGNMGFLMHYLAGIMGRNFGGSVLPNHVGLVTRVSCQSSSECCRKSDDDVTPEAGSLSGFSWAQACLRICSLVLT